MNLNSLWIKLFEENRLLLGSRSSELMNSRRNAALEQFKLKGIPSTKVETYKYTDLQPFFGTDTKHSFLSGKKTMRIPDFFHCNVESMEVYTYFTVNGYFVQPEGDMQLPEGVIVESFAEATVKHASLVAQYYGEIAPAKTDAFVALNTMFALDGYFIYIPQKTALTKPIQIVNILIDDENLNASQRNMVILDDMAQAQIIVCDHTLSAAQFVMNTVTEVQTGESAILDFCNLQNQHNHSAQVGGFFVNQEKYSVARTNFITLNAGMARNNISVRLGGANAECFLSGLYLCDKNQHVDNFTSIDHAVADCCSNELFKGVMDDASTAIFTGKIMVRTDAQRTVAYQSNNNLLLTSEARINTAPQLTIYADDVKCSHGATVGQLDKNALFYMRQRGISHKEANILLQYAFAYEVIEKIKVPALKEQIRSLVEKRFRGQLDKCDSCTLCGRFDNKVGC